LAVEGLLLRDALNNWYMNFQQWVTDTGSCPEDSQSLLALIYYHAISIFLSGIFDYHSEFHHIITPALSRGHIQNHVDNILMNSRKGLKTTNLGGILFFFPLRVAGARVAIKEEADAIVAMLDEISKRSFVVADSFVSDLKSLWLGKGLREEPICLKPF
jgi:hypothetical protein